MYFYAMSRTIKDSYLYFTRKERRGSLLLLILVVLVSLSPFLYSLLNPKQMTTSHEFDEQLASLKETDAATQKSRNNGSNEDGHHYPDQNFRSPADARESRSRHLVSSELPGRRLAALCPR